MPLYTAAASALKLLTSQFIAAPVAAVDFTASIDGTYEEYWLHFRNVLTATDITSLFVRTSSNGGASFDNGASDYGPGLAQIGLSTGAGPTNSATYGGQSGWVRFINPAKASGYKTIFWEVASMKYDFTVFASGRGANQRQSAAAINAFRVAPDSGNISSGVLNLYGVQK